MNPPSYSSIDQAVARLRDGDVVAFPTDTVYGIGVDPFQPEAVRKLYQIKGRPDDKPIAILVGSIEDVGRVAQNPPPTFTRLAEQSADIITPVAVTWENDNSVVRKLITDRCEISGRSVCHRLPIGCDGDRSKQRRRRINRGDRQLISIFDVVVID